MSGRWALEREQSSDVTGPIAQILDHRLLSVPAIVVHGGAGTFDRIVSPDDESALEEGLRDALEAGWRLLDLGGAAFDAAVEAVASLESSGVFNAGRSASRTADGTLELDAAVMDGRTGHAGGVCATTWPRNPVRAALAVASLGGPVNGPVLLAGTGADQFAEDAGLERMEDDTDQGARDETSAGPFSHAGTVGAVAVDSDGHLGAATSTGGRSEQRRGRVGDSPIIGAGTWADDDTAAVSATGDGESFVVAGFAHHVDWAIRLGSSLSDAVVIALAEVGRRGGDGGAIAITPTGEASCIFDTKAMARGWKDSVATQVAVLGGLG